MVGTVDSTAAALEADVIEPGVAAEMSGTSTLFRLPNDRGMKEPTLMPRPHVVPGTDLLLGAMVSSGASLRWFRDQLGIMKVSGCSVDSFDSLTEQAGQVRVGSDWVIFLPYMMGERSPLWHSNVRGVFLCLSLTTRRKTMVRAFLEGVAFALRHNMDVAISAGAEIREVRSVGGCSRSDVLNQIKADVLGQPFLLPRHPIGAAFGDAILAGIGTGVFLDIRKCLREMVQIEKRFEPNQSKHEYYMRIHPLFLKLYQDLKEDCGRLAELMQFSAPKSRDSVTKP
jgi:xylulokinase